MNSPLLIYFDQNIWIQLENARHYPDNPKFTDLNKIIEKLSELINLNKIRLVMNLTNFGETIQRSEPKSRDNLGSFILDLTKAYSFLPLPYIQKYEILSYLSSLGLYPKINILDKVVGRGVEFIVGPFSFIPKDPKDLELKKRLEKSKSLLEPIIQSPEFSKMVVKKSFRQKETKIDYIKGMEKIKAKILPLSHSKRIVYQMNGDCDFLIRKIIEFVQENQIILKSPKELIPKFNDIKSRIKFMQKFPSFYCQSSLTSFRNANTERKINTNDHLDVMSLSFPIAYFDYVVGEKYFINLAQQAKLDSLYGSQLFTKIQSLDKKLA